MESKTPTWFLTVERQNRIFTVVLKAAKNLQKPHPKNVLIFVDCQTKSLFTGYYDCVSMRKSENIIRFLISASLPNYPSPNPTFCPKWEVSVKCWLRGGVGGQLHRNLNWSNPPTLSSRIKFWSDSQHFDEVLVLKVYVPRPPPSLPPSPSFLQRHLFFFPTWSALNTIYSGKSSCPLMIFFYTFMALFSLTTT